MARYFSCHFWSLHLSSLGKHCYRLSLHRHLLNSLRSPILRVELHREWNDLSPCFNPLSHSQRIPGNKGSKEICKNVGLLNTFLCLLVILLDTSGLLPFFHSLLVPNREQLVFSPLRARHATLQVVFARSLSARKCWSPLLCILGPIRCTPMLCTRCREFWERFGRGCCSVFGRALCSSYPAIFIARRGRESVWFREDPNQCLTYSKIVATIIVTTGIIIFTMGKQRVASHLLSDSGTENQWFVCWTMSTFWFTFTFSDDSWVSCPVTLLFG